MTRNYLAMAKLKWFIIICLGAVVLGILVGIWPCSLNVGPLSYNIPFGNCDSSSRSSVLSATTSGGTNSSAAVIGMLGVLVIVSVAAIRIIRVYGIRRNNVAKGPTQLERVLRSFALEHLPLLQQMLDISSQELPKREAEIREYYLESLQSSGIDQTVVESILRSFNDVLTGENLAIFEEVKKWEDPVVKPLMELKPILEAVAQLRTEVNHLMELRTSAYFAHRRLQLTSHDTDSYDALKQAAIESAERAKTIYDELMRS